MLTVFSTKSKVFFFIITKRFHPSPRKVIALNLSLPDKLHIHNDIRSVRSMVRSFHKKVSLTVRNTFIYVPIATLYSDHIDTFRKLYVTFCMWNDLTFLWNELTFFGGGGGRSD